ncbi:MAG: response regulator [Magnetovibrio sp.]|nr:response regulator [Magnetovibrio sp.]
MAPRTPNLTELSILVVDDESIIRNMVEHALKAISIRSIVLAPDGIKALRVLENTPEPFDIIICDWMMPNMDGMEFLRQVKGRGEPAKFLMLTGKATREAVSEAISAGIDSYIAKPFTAAELHKKVKFLAKRIAR